MHYTAAITWLQGSALKTAQLPEIDTSVSPPINVTH